MMIMGDGWKMIHGKKHFRVPFTWKWIHQLRMLNVDVCGLIHISYMLKVHYILHFVMEKRMSAFMRKSKSFMEF